MVDIKLSQLNWLGAGITLVLMSTVITPASAQQVIVIDRSNPFSVSQPPAVGSFIYGSPIPTPMPVDPTTGLLPSRTIYPNYYPQVRYDRFNNSTLVNPTLINPIIKDSTIVNPVIINNSWQRTPFRGRSRVIITHPW
ncbi:hypothetical protein BCD64_14690 [Nostoc sp. MBR 210]|uniref:Uncharacterized protein n=1 Tax=Nostoc spongiaeforme FACHB-130 TaxID=1357510 RepID=A0ABR8G0B2_9NOSO|nr:MULTISPECIES: hypothetical protein [Nostoc]MBD2498366.1 hypothetical protein [Nostoc sp. FACHB-280]MBD2596647.1 hypothetical protein [Nostoc spongiaeforme FACHB-130]OCQ96848.1 hypothetical protein BCD64_14690 [Nostoc sp. MBR 210]